MPTTLTTQAVEESTFVVTAAFTDEDAVAVVPKTAVWTLSDKDGTVINGRLDVTISPLAASVDIVLSGDDLAIADGKTRKLTIKATYDSDAGTDLPLNDELSFQIQRLVGVT